MKPLYLRQAFSMLTAILVIVLMSAVGVFVMNLSGKIVKSTTVQYQHEQAVLYAKSYTEYAVMAITGNNRSSQCLQTIQGTIGAPVATGAGYRIRTHIAYIANGTEVNMSKCAPIRVLNSSVGTAKTPLTVIIDAYVDYKDPDNTGGPWMTVHRRTVQKI